MCYHTSQTKTTSQLESRFKVKRNPSFDIGETDFTFYHRNGFAHEYMLMIPQEAPELLTPAMWGLMPTDRPGADHRQYYKESVKYGRGLNARSEKLFDHFIYKHSALTKRCLVPLNGFFEPHRHNGKNYPYFIGRSDRESFALAGIYNKSNDGYITLAILTKQASPYFADIHNVKQRQPVLLNPETEKQWLDPTCTPTDLKTLLGAAYPESELQAYTVSKDLYSRTKDSNTSHILDQVQYPELSSLF
ncbi:SOS response-associated peptidase [Robertkochia sediminum]|uniref:SOS response-associated peptidase n=1 Tax=Robertkochia sediminum TaxID=2785326 RepID=UPI001932DB30|nr:SOS response-associated peptidase [Robertkochia sediminum]MBL7473983.1 SOS response-associated peptidase [Robertkochia sediminum]